MRSFTKASFVAPVALALSGLCHASNYLQDPGFEQWNAGESHETLTGTGSGSVGAVDWSTFNLNNGVANTYQVTPPSGLSTAGDYSLYLTETAAGNGISQNTYVLQGGQDIPDIYNGVSGWFDLISGSIGIEYVDNTTQQLVLACSTSQTGGWVYLSANLNSVGSPAFAVVALSANTQVYIDNLDADSQPVPEPASVTVLWAAGLGLLRRKFKVARPVK